jgi:hypothetical protein
MAYAGDDSSDSDMSEVRPAAARPCGPRAGSAAAAGPNPLRQEDLEEDVLAPAAGQRPPAVNNQDGLASALEEFAWPRDTPWIETLAVPVRRPNPLSAATCTSVRSVRGASVATVVLEAFATEIWLRLPSVDSASLLPQRPALPTLALPPPRLRRLHATLTPLAPTQVADDGSEKDAIPNVDDDVARESVFHQRALAAVVAAGAQLAAAGVPVRRPDDYYAEMVKNDAHMRKVKDKLLFEQRQLDAKAERRRDRENKQYGKQVQAEKLKERKAQQKSDMRGQLQSKYDQEAQAGPVPGYGDLTKKFTLEDFWSDPVTKASYQLFYYQQF